MNEYFNYQGVAARIGVEPDQLCALEESVRRQYGRDQMMFELRMLRTLHAVEEGVTTIDRAIAEMKDEAIAPVPAAV